MKAGKLRHRVTLQYQGAPVADTDGGFTNTASSLSPARVWASIEPASARMLGALGLERVAENTVINAATTIVTLRHHAGLTTKSKVIFGSRTLTVIAVVNPKEMGVETIALCTEAVA